jgi:hypothetical protein
MKPESIDIDNKYGIRIQDRGATLYLTRYGIQWHEPIAQKPWIAAFFEIERLREEIKILKGGNK